MVDKQPFGGASRTVEAPPIFKPGGSIMANILQKFTQNEPISPVRRVLSPLVSAIVSLLIPGLAQVLNGQTAKGLCILLSAFAVYSLNLVNTPVFTILLYMIMLISSSDAYFIASRMKLGEEVRSWSILFLDIHAPTEKGLAQAHRTTRTLITDVTVIDGTGSPAFCADVLLEGDFIRCIRRHLERKEKVYRIVSGQGKLLLPGLIHPCTQNENAYFSASSDTLALRCGYTTELLGSCGLSRAPVAQAHSQEIESLWNAVYGKPEVYTFFSNIGEYLIQLDRQIKPVQTESMIGYNTLRTNVVGLCETIPNSEQMEKILSRIASGAKSGACGVSLNLTGQAGPVIGSEESRMLLSACAAAELPVLVVPAQEPLAHTQRQMLQKLADETGAKLLLSEPNLAQPLWEIRDHLQKGTLPQWVSQHTMKTAADFSLFDRGLIREGMSADLLLIKPHALPDSPSAEPRGLEKVWVKGELQYDTEPALDVSGLPQKSILGIPMH